MSTCQGRSRAPEPRAVILASQNIAGGIFLIAVAVLALWLTRDLDQGTLNTMGPAMLPNWLAYGVGLCGIALIVLAFLGQGNELEHWNLRGPLMLMAGILSFAVTIRPFPLGSLEFPGLGLAVAGPLAIIIGGFASPEARLRELITLSLSLTPFCIVLFGDLLNLPIPIFPQSLTGLFPADWSEKSIIRATAAAMAILAVFFIGWGLASRRVDGADHSGTI